MIICRKCRSEMICIDPFTWYCPNGLDGKHQVVLGDGTIVPDYISCKKCEQIFPTRRATHFSHDQGWVRTSWVLVYLRPDLYDLNLHLCFKCTPKDIIKWDYVRSKITGKGK